MDRFYYMFIFEYVKYLLSGCNIKFGLWYKCKNNEI